MSDSQVSISFLILRVVCVPPIASGSSTTIFETEINLSLSTSRFVTSSILITSGLSERKSKSSQVLFE